MSSSASRYGLPLFLAIVLGIAISLAFLIRVRIDVQREAPNAAAERARP
ncbi:hypothetical protein KJZ71_04010 [Patescibacteria group bacterium]|uniref:Uncharacterized protein n=1 Tax=candidate division WWE3 bacterium TaxID=2053526 RepID=A0A928TQL5_UNCKA|nr:hypothetical protein [candidate division WWE3 bacterium]MCL4732936.1 hypothetical protein [Patescibacteria group bacterium]